MKKITEITRRDIIEVITDGIDIAFTEKAVDYYEREYEAESSKHVFMKYYGRCTDEVTFLKRLYNLSALPSFDSRFEDSEGDIWQHTISNDDWGEFWVFDDERFLLAFGNEDCYFLNFICEMFHPVVRDEKQHWKEFLDKINSLLKTDGYELYEKEYISGRAVYGWREIGGKNKVIETQIKDIKEAFDSEYINRQVELMVEQISISPYIAIGKAKELLETCSKTILEEQNIPIDPKWDLIKLVKECCKSIGLEAKQVNDKLTAKPIAAKILGSLSVITQGMAELRNIYGDGHGKRREFSSLPPRYADLAVGVAVACVKFMWETYKERKNN